MAGFWGLALSFVVGGVTFVPLVIALAMAVIYYAVSAQDHNDTPPPS